MTSVLPPAGIIGVKSAIFYSSQPNIMFLGSAILSCGVFLGHPVVCSRFHEDIFLMLPFVRHSIPDGK